VAIRVANGGAQLGAGKCGATPPCRGKATRPARVAGASLALCAALAAYRASAI
jgi:hypothetical protein